MQVNYNKTSYEDWLAKSYVKQMSGNQHNRQAATWRKLYLSRAKLKASSSTSALLSGFAMVRMKLKYMFVAFTDFFFTSMRKSILYRMAHVTTAFCTDVT